jgi:hypothetical protein
MEIKGVLKTPFWVVLFVCLMITLFVCWLIDRDSYYTLTGDPQRPRP